MSKLIAAMIATGGAATVTVGGSYLLQKGSASEVKQPNLKTQDTDNPELKFSTLTDFKTKKGYKCSDPIFPDNFAFGDLTNINGTSISGDFLGTPPSTIDNKVKSCLVINGEKKTYTEESNKGSGTFTGTGSFVNDTKGFIVTAIATTDKGNEKLKVTGGAYLLEKKTSSGTDTGEVKHKKEDSSVKDFDTSKFKEKFPKVKAGSGVTVDTGNYWGFMTGEGDLKNICATCTDSADNKGTTRKLEEFKWTHKPGDDKNIGGGSDNLEGGNEMFEKNSFDLASKLTSFKGTGSKAEKK